MKKRLKGLLALCLALCLVMGMTIGVASADSVAVNVYDAYSDSGIETVVETGEYLYSGYSGGYLGVYYEGNVATEDPAVKKDLFVKNTSTNPESYDPVQVSYYEQTDWKTENRPQVRAVDEFGYVKNQWKLSSDMADTGDYYYQDVGNTGYTTYLDIPIMYEAHLTKILINYTIKYVEEDGSQPSPDDVSEFNVEAIDGNIKDPADLGFEKEGFKASKWKLADGSTVDPDTEIEAIYEDLIDNAVAAPSGAADEMEILLTVVWEEDNGGNEPGGNEPGGNEPGGNEPAGNDGGKEDKVPADKGDDKDVPKTGDNNTFALWIMALATAMIAGAGIKLSADKNKK